jgi:hypothetical protein
VFEQILTGGLAAAASAAGAGFLASAANSSQFADATLKLASFLDRKVRPSLRSELEDLSYDVALIYTKFSRRCFLWGLWSLFISGLVVIDFPTPDNVELFVDVPAAVLPVGALLLTLIRRKLHRMMRLRLIISAEEMGFILAYESLVDRYIQMAISSSKNRRFLEAHSNDELERMLGMPRPIGGPKDAHALLGRLHDAKLTRVVRGLSVHDIDHLRHRSEWLIGSDDRAFKAIGYNNKAVAAWWAGDFGDARDLIASARNAATGCGGLVRITGDNYAVLHDDSLVGPSGPMESESGNPRAVRDIQR